METKIFEAPGIAQDGRDLGTFFGLREVNTTEEDVIGEVKRSGDNWTGVV